MVPILNRLQLPQGYTGVNELLRIGIMDGTKLVLQYIEQHGNDFFEILVKIERDPG